MKSDNELLRAAAELLGVGGYHPQIAHLTHLDAEWMGRRDQWVKDYKESTKHFDFVCSKCGGTGLSK